MSPTNFTYFFRLESRRSFFCCFVFHFFYDFPLFRPYQQRQVLLLSFVLRKHSKFGFVAGPSRQCHWQQNIYIPKDIASMTIWWRLLRHQVIAVTVSFLSLLLLLHYLSQIRHELRDVRAFHSQTFILYACVYCVQRFDLRLSKITNKKAWSVKVFFDFLGLCVVPYILYVVVIFVAIRLNLSHQIMIIE